MRENRIIQLGFIFLALTVVLVFSRPLFADPPLDPPLILPICGDEDEYNVIERCTELTLLRDVQLYRVPGTNTEVTTYDFVYRDAYLFNELGFFYVDDQAGRIDGKLPGEAGYAAAALNRAVIIFPGGSNPFTQDKVITMDSGRLLIFYMVQNDSTANLLANNPNNLVTGSPRAFFSLDLLNPDNTADHFVGFENIQQGYSEFGFEDELEFSDWDYDDVVYTVSPPPIPVYIDSDGDGLADVWENDGVDTDLNGTLDLDLAAAGADPTKKDIFVWIDWLIGSDNVSHRPSDEAINMVVAAYAKQGVQLHIKWGSAIPETAANQTLIDFSLDPGSGELTLNTTDWKNVRHQYFLNNGANPGRASVYHYALFGHNVGVQPVVCPQNTGVHPAGWALGSDFVVGLQRAVEKGELTPTLEGLVFMHQLGHTLGLGHGGITLENQQWNPQTTDYKPNHLSVMNQAFASVDQQGLTVNGLSGVLDYSIFGPSDIPTLNENSLNETAGLNSTNPEVSKYATRWYCGAGDSTGKFVANANAPIDWSCDGDSSDNQVKANVNRSMTAPTCSEQYDSSLTTINEWQQLNFVYANVGMLGNVIPPFPDQVVLEGSEREMPLEFLLDPYILNLPLIIRSKTR